MLYRGKLYYTVVLQCVELVTNQMHPLAPW